MFIQN